MANLYTDEVRLARYEMCRRRAKRCETVFDISMWSMILLALLEVGPNLAKGFLYGIFIGDLEPFFVMLAVTAAMVFSIYAIFRRDWRFLLGGLICSLVLTTFGVFMLFGYLSPVVLLIAMVVSLDWRRLEKEEGFPHFEISYAEWQGQQKLQERRARSRAVQSGTYVRQEQLNAHADMSDLLDTDAEQLPAELKNYHNRSFGADAVVRPGQQPHSDRMDQLDDMDEL